jgi:uncharacterized sodium:solute symporter family permease YidK
MLFGFVFSKLKEEEVTQRVRNHECVHARQWFEVTVLSGSILLSIVLVFGISPWWMLLSGGIYYVWYVLEWMCKCVWYSVMIDEWTCEMETPYQSISFEREARLSERDNNYLENGGYFGWLKEL